MQAPAKSFPLSLAGQVRLSVAVVLLALQLLPADGTIKTTPAVAAGIIDKPLTIADLIDRTANYNPPQRTGDWGKFLDSLPDA